MNTSIWGMTLKAICLENFVRRRLSLTKMPLVCAHSSSTPSLPAPRNRLVGRDHHALDLAPCLQRLQRHHHLRRRAVRVGDDVLAVVARHVGVEHMRVHLGHHQRHIGVVAPEADELSTTMAAGRADLLAIFLGHRRARRHQREIDAR